MHGCSQEKGYLQLSKVFLFVFGVEKVKCEENVLVSMTLAKWDYDLLLS